MTTEFLNSPDEILSVAEFSRRFKMLLKTKVPELWLRGEVSNFKIYPSGHSYFTLKDAEASISAVLFKNNAGTFRAKLADGARVLLYGEVAIYEARGSYQLIVKAVLEDGVGELAKRFEALKQKLEQEGLFAAQNKREIPAFVRRIAVVTSPSGAVIRDFVSILRRRGWKGIIDIYPAKVQGLGAAEEIAKGVRAADAARDYDLIIPMRGGGSLEDLWPFNEELAARAVAACQTPIISAVGHETDFTLCDFAADLRAETPSAAAELISSNYLELTERYADAREELQSLLRMRFEALNERIERAGQILRLNSPSSKIENLSLRIDEFYARLGAALRGAFEDKRGTLKNAELLFERHSPVSRINLMRQKLDFCGRTLEGLSFESTLSRGFAMVFDASGAGVYAAKDLSKGQKISLRFADGERPAEIEDDLSL